jgi:hypothetical protein
MKLLITMTPEDEQYAFRQKLKIKPSEIVHDLLYEQQHRQIAIPRHVDSDYILD